MTPFMKLLLTVTSMDTDCEFKIGFTVIRSRLDDALYTSVETFFLDLQQMLLSPPKSPDFAVLIIPDGLPVSNDSYPPRVTAVLSAEESSEFHPLASQILEHIKPLVADARRAEAELDYNPMGQTPSQIQHHWAEFDKTVGKSLGKLTDLPTEVSSSLNAASGALTKAPRSPSASVYSAYHTPPTFPGGNSRPALMWHDGKPPWHVAPFEPHGLSFHEEISPGTVEPSDPAGTPLSELPAERMNGILSTDTAYLTNNKNSLLAGMPLSPPSAPTPETKATETELHRKQLPSPAVTAVNNSSPPEGGDEEESPLSSLVGTPSPKREKGKVEVKEKEKPVEKVEKAEKREAPTQMLVPSVVISPKSRTPMTPRRASARVKGL